MYLKVFVGDSRIGKAHAANVSEVGGLPELFLTILVDKPFGADQIFLLILKNKRRIHKVIRGIRRLHFLDKVCRDRSAVIVTVKNDAHLRSSFVFLEEISEKRALVRKIRADLDLIVLVEHVDTGNRHRIHRIVLVRAVEPFTFAVLKQNNVVTSVVQHIHVGVEFVRREAAHRDSLVEQITPRSEMKFKRLRDLFGVVAHYFVKVSDTVKNDSVGFIKLCLKVFTPWLVIPVIYYKDAVVRRKSGKL